MKKRTLAMLATLAIGVGAVGFGLLKDTTLTTKAVTPNANESFTFYESESLATALNGKTFNWLNADDAFITHNDKKIRGSLGFSTRSDTTFYENAGSLGETPNGTTQYQVYGYPEIYCSGTAGPTVTGFECSFDEAFLTTDISLVTFEIGFHPENGNASKFRGDTKPFTAYAYLYGNDGTTEKQVLVETVSFGIGFFTTAILDLSQTDFVSVSRMAIAVDFNAFDDADESLGQVNLTGTDLLVIANVSAHAQTEDVTERTLSANENGVYFFNGASLASVLEDAEYSRVYRTNGPQVAFGIGGIPNTDYKYCTPRISVDDYIVMCFREPINVRDYKFFDAKLLIWPQGEDPYLPNVLQESATDFTVTALQSNAANLDDGYAMHFARATWQTCRIPLERFADENGYVTKIILHYTDNDAYGHQSQDQKRYNVNLAMYNGILTNYEETELLVTYITAPTKNADGTFGFNLKSTIEFTHGEKISETFKSAIKINGKTLTELIEDGKASVLLSGYFIKLTLDESVMKLDNTDSVEIAKNVAVKGNVKTLDDEKFIYSADLRRFELVPDRTAFDGQETGIGVEVVEMGNPNAFDFFDAGQLPCNSIWTSFNGTATTMGLGVAHQSLEELASSSGNTDIYNYHLAKLGVYESVMDYVYVNGKSLREWMVIDATTGRSGYIRVIFMGFGFNTGKSFVVQSATGSALELGMGRDMSIEFKKGFTTASMQRFQHDIKYCISAKEADGANSLFSAMANLYPVENTDNDTGCSSVLSTSVMLALALACFATTKMIRKEND